MGQFWTVINIDKSQKYDLWPGRRHSVCFGTGSTSSALVSFLSLKPTSPPSSPHLVSTPSLIGSWAGDRIIYVGDYGEDIPNGLLTDAEIQKFIEEPSENVEYHDINLWNFSCEHFYECEMVPYPHTLGSASQNDWVLRNLTTHEYVRSDVDGLNTTEFFEETPDTNKPGLGDILFSRISWSSSSGSVDYGGATNKILRGVWAGNRFDIRTIDTVEGGDEEWKDVSEEVLEEILALWESQGWNERW